MIETIEQKPPVLAIDGPSGAGKGTVSRRVARHYGWHLLDSGALYRLVALTVERRGVDPDDEAAVAALAAGLDVRFESDELGEEVVLLEGEEVTGEIRTEQCGARASRVASLPSVRRSLVALQHQFRQPPGLVADGRDMGTVIFPSAGLKVFLTASAKERAERRHKQLKLKGIDGNFPDLYADIRRRDERDSQRAVSPLVPAEDAMVIDTTDLTIDEVVVTIMRAACKVYGPPKSA